MKKIKYFFFVVLLAFSSKLLSQDQTILIFDPNGVSTSFQYTLSQLTDDSVFVADSLDNSIYNYDAAFLFIDYPYLLTVSNVNTLTNYTSDGKPTYLYSNPVIDSTSFPFWNHIGLNEMYWLLVSSLVDSVTGIDTTFTTGIVIDTSFMTWSVPAPMGTIAPILIGQSASLDVQATFISTVDTLEVILDLYNLIDDEGFLRRVLEYFELQPPNYVDEEIISLTEFVLSQNYPNPFNPTTSIQYAVSSRQFVSIKVFDILGNEIATLVNEEKQPGTYEVEFNIYSDEGRNLSSGVYFYQLRIGVPETSSGQGFIETKKMILIK